MINTTEDMKYRLENDILKVWDGLPFPSLLKVLEFRATKLKTTLALKIRAAGRFHPARLEFEQRTKGSTLKMQFGAKHETYCSLRGIVQPTNMDFWASGTSEWQKRQFLGYRYMSNIPVLWDTILEYCRGKEFWTKDRPSYHANKTYVVMKLVTSSSKKFSNMRKNRNRRSQERIEKGLKKLVKFFTPTGNERVHSNFGGRLAANPNPSVQNTNMEYSLEYVQKMLGPEAWAAHQEKRKLMRGDVVQMARVLFEMDWKLYYDLYTNLQHETE